MMNYPVAELSSEDLTGYRVIYRKEDACPHNVCPVVSLTPQCHDVFFKVKFKGQLGSRPAPVLAGIVVGGEHFGKLEVCCSVILTHRLPLSKAVTVS